MHVDTKANAMNAGKLLLASACAVVALSQAPAADAATKKAKLLDPTSAQDQFTLNRKNNCSLVDNRPTVYWWAGNLYGRVRGEPDRLLFKLSGMNIRHCVSVNDPEKGAGYRTVSRELMLYLDPETGEVVRNWKNPWTGEVVEVIQVANDPPQGASNNFPRKEAANSPFANIVVEGDVLSGGGAARLFYENPMAGDYQEYVGGTYHAMEWLTSASPEADLFDATNPILEDRVISWGRISKWLPWMKMGDREGLMVYHTAGLLLDNYDEMPDVMKREIDANFPLYKAPPPFDYPKGKETTWTVVKDAIDAKRAKDKAATK